MLPRDPTRADLLAFLAPLAFSYEADDFDTECAAYWYAADFHGGLFSNLYSALSVSPFRPGMLDSAPWPDSPAELLYLALVNATPET